MRLYIHGRIKDYLKVGSNFLRGSGFNQMTVPALSIQTYRLEQTMKTQIRRTPQGLFLIVLGFNDTLTLVGHFVSPPIEREKRDRSGSRGDNREGQGRKRKTNESEETEEIKTFPL